MHICISRFYLIQGDPVAVAEAFRTRPGEVDQVDGFLSMWAGQNAADANEFVVEVRFKDAATFMAWHRSPAFRLAHGMMPPGLKLDPDRTSLTRYDLLTE